MPAWSLRIIYTVVATAVCAWMMSTGELLGGLVIVPAIAVWLRRPAETGRLARLVKPT